ncbi:ExbD/TolR family protein [Polynucleobacter rarus]|jgi:biopolymer transport protein ExbD|uniref:ExbD/TolR family protein n=1 Tax=Polynucleobacter rarus TaxID=556055 RepID=UPI000D3EA621|nr:biopolymer transporter ExbD [Polynucleobacter rarus]
MIKRLVEKEEVMATINTTPLVDVMLVLLIIFLMTIPVAVQTHSVILPKEVNQIRVTKPEDINISINQSGKIFWNDYLIKNDRELTDRLKEISSKRPQPDVHVRGDREAEYEAVAKILLACQRAGISKVGFLTEPPPKG